MRVELLNESHDPEYIAFLDRLGQTSPSVLGYYYPFYRDMLTSIGVGTPLYWGAWQGGELVGILPGFTRRADPGISYCSLPYFGPNAGVLCAADEMERPVHSALIAAVLDYMHSQRDPLTASFYTPFYFDRYQCYDVLLPEAIIVPKSTLFLFLPDAMWDGRDPLQP